MLRALVLALLVPLALAGCGDDEPAVVQNFAPLQYEFLPKLRLNVGSIEVVDHSQPAGPQDIAAQSPAVPEQVLAQMARDRLFAAGTAGIATFVIDQASITQAENGTLDGRLTVHLDLTTGAGMQGGYAEAKVARQYVPGSDAQDLRANLYQLTKQMMNDMNVEFEYQLRRTLGNWMVSGTSVPAPVVAQPLAPPGLPAGIAAPPSLPPAVPETEQQAAPQDGYVDPAMPPPPPQMSPPPGYLQAPPGATQTMPPASPGY
jgi:hypothetical protein